MKTTLKATLAAAVIAAVSVLQAPAANAVVTGSAYFVPEANAQNAVIGSPALTAANLVATFSVPNGPINFDSAVGGYTLGGFLASSPGEITLTGTAANLAAPLDVGGVRGTMIEIKGLVSVVNGQTFTVTHDDGLQLQIGALLVVNTPGPSSPTVTTVTYTGPTGTFAFDLVYGECCGAPAVLATSLPLNPVPEPASLALLGSALIGMGLLRRRRNRA